MVDNDGATPLTGGSPADGDGATIALGYFTGATDAANFDGSWVPLTGPLSANVPFQATSAGDNNAGDGYFFVRTDFDEEDAATIQDVPAAGTRLAVAIFNRTSIDDSTHFNIATHDAWRWEDPDLAPQFVLINLNDSGTQWLGGDGSEGRTAIPLATFPGYPVITAGPAHTGVDSGGDMILTVTATGEAPLAYQWFKNGVELAGETSSTLMLTGASASDAAGYRVRVSNTHASVDSATALVAVHSSPARLVNISTRGYVGTGDEVLIPGFVSVGSGGNPVLIRAVGPTLTAFGLDPALVLEDPILSIRNNLGDEIAANDDWSNQPDAAAVAAAFTASGAFPLPSGTFDAALLVTPTSNETVTALVSGANGSTGVAIAEIYLVEGNQTDHFINISTRGRVATGSNVMIPGFYLGNGGTRRLLVRAVGPTLGGDPFNVPGVVTDPVLCVRRTSDNQEVASNDDWEEAGQGSAVASAAAQAFAFELGAGSADAALILTVPPSAPNTSDRGFTVEVYDAAGGTGMVIAEIYELP